MIKYKLSEIAKNLNVTSKEVSEVLKTYLNVNKKSGAGTPDFSFHAFKCIIS
jgi:hypothetical protein